MKRCYFWMRRDGNGLAWIRLRLALLLSSYPCPSCLFRITHPGKCLPMTIIIQILYLPLLRLCTLHIRTMLLHTLISPMIHLLGRHSQFCTDGPRVQLLVSKKS